MSDQTEGELVIRTASRLGLGLSVRPVTDQRLRASTSKQHVECVPRCGEKSMMVLGHSVNLYASRMARDAAGNIDELTS